MSRHPDHEEAAQGRGDTRLDCLPEPCGSCPYRRDCPSGVWDESEYEKLRQYAESGGAFPLVALSPFLCHQTNATGRETLCRGWLTVERDSLAVRLMLIRGRVTLEQVAAPVATPLYATGDEAAEAGLAGVERPSQEAARMIRRLLAKGAGRP